MEKNITGPERPSEAFDFFLTNARIIDPESGRDFPGSLGIRGSKIGAVYPDPGGLGNLREREGDHWIAAVPGGKIRTRELIDLRGLILTSGFIDIHTHSDSTPFCGEKLLAMGVTTTLSGNCGGGADDMVKFRADFPKSGYSVNQAELTGHNKIRRRVGLDDIMKPASAEQIAEMKDITRRALEEGAAGVSFGLEYTPGASEEEVLALAQLAADAGKPVAIHSRVLDYGGDTASFTEAMEIPVKTGGRLIYSHLVYMYVGDLLKQVAETAEKYRALGADIWIDSGMYASFATRASTEIFKESLFESGIYQVEKLRAATGKYTGQRLDWEKYRDIRANHGDTTLVYDLGTDEDIFTAYSLPRVMVSSDAMQAPPGQGHPQGAATFPYFLRSVVREAKRMPLLEGLRRCTLYPAEALGYGRKGRIALGCDADLVVLDWDRLQEKADFPGLGDPGTPPEGIPYVWVNGVLSIRDSKRVANTYGGQGIWKHQ